MDIHKPKSWRGWREFLKEYLIIVVGVLTALGAEQAVEWLHWRQLAAGTEADLADGLRWNLRDAVNWIASRPCDQARLVELSQALRAAPAQWRGTSQGYVDSIGDQPRVTPTVLLTPNPLWTHDAWEKATSAGALSHMPQGRVALYGAAYRVVDLARNWQFQAVIASDQLGALAYDGALTGPERAGYLNTLAQIESLQNGVGIESRYLFRQANALGVGLTQSQVDDGVARVRKRRGACVAGVKLPIQ
jgi:hypothetical protein